MNLHLGKGRKVQAVPSLLVDATSLPPVTEETPVAQELTLVGVTFSNYNFETLRLYQPVMLVPDPLGAVVKPDSGGHNDPYAISVQDQSRQHIGYLPKQTAKVITSFWQEHPDMQAQAHVLRIKGGTDGLSYGVDILVRFGFAEAQSA